MKLLIISVFLFLLLFSVDAEAQKIFKFACDNQQPKTEREFKIWLKEDVGYIITKAETEAFFKLQTDEERNSFIEKFWHRRDPNPNTKANEFRDEYCERVKETEKFNSGILGWRTDRGRVYILYGKPAEIEHGRTDFEGQENVLFEKWIYRYTSGFSFKSEIVFFDPMEINEYRLSKDKARILFDSLKDIDF